MVCKFLEKRLDYHRILGYSVIVFGIGTICFSFADNDYTRGISLYIAAIACVQLTVYESICLIDMFKNDNLDAWLQVNHGVFGIGGLLGPLLVYIFERKCFLLIGIFALLFAYPFFKIKSPEHVSE